MEEMEKKMALITQKLTEIDTIDGDQGPWDLPTASWTMSERYAKNNTYKPQ